MIPVRRWPLAAVLLLMLSAAPVMRAIRWPLVLTAGVDLVWSAASGDWASAAVWASVLPVGWWCSVRAERGSREFRAELEAIRDAGPAGEGGDPS